ncbi:MAG: hypothetical protein Q8P60_06095 [Pseudorhodobacter sp.]|nr:hypothetical protein [Pseudorhodobacter sp.]
MPHFAHPFLILALILALTACAVVPDLGPQPAPAGPAPQILPLDGLLAEAQGSRITVAMGPALAARAARLRARAAVMRAPVTDQVMRARLAALIARGAGV